MMSQIIYLSERISKMEKDEITHEEKVPEIPTLDLFLDYGPMRIEGLPATELYHDILKKKDVLEKNAGQARFTSPIKLNDGSHISIAVHKLSGYRYHEGSKSPEDRVDDMIGRLTDFVKQNKST